MLPCPQTRISVLQERLFRTRVIGEPEFYAMKILLLTLLFGVILVLAQSDLPRPARRAHRRVQTLP